MPMKLLVRDVAHHIPADQTAFFMVIAEKT
jgi:hypothetical protein